MIYNIDTIPAKTFFKIQETNDLTLLSDEKLGEKKLVEVWNKILSKYKDIAGVKTNNRALQLSSKIKALKAKYLSVSISVKTLIKGRNNVCEQILKDFGYKLSEDNYEKDLETISRNINSIKIRISRYETDLNRLLPKEDSKSKNSFEDNLMAMCVILEFGYINSNKVLLLDFLSLVKQTEAKIRSLEKINSKSN